MKTIKINSKDFPCRFTMGAALEFKEQTGKEVTALDGAGLSDVMCLLWCCIRSACRIDKVEFNMTLQELADQVDMQTFVSWQNSNFDQSAATASTKGAAKKK